MLINNNTKKKDFASDIYIFLSVIWYLGLRKTRAQFIFYDFSTNIQTFSNKKIFFKSRIKQLKQQSAISVSTV